jgi:hypothetical protein
MLKVMLKYLRGLRAPQPVDMGALTEFETQLVTMFELDIDNVKLSQVSMAIPHMPLLDRDEIGNWRVSPSILSGYGGATNYRGLTANGQRLVEQMYLRALTRPVPVESKPAATPSAGKILPSAAAAMKAAHDEALRYQHLRSGVGSMQMPVPPPSALLVDPFRTP